MLHSCLIIIAIFVFNFSKFRHDNLREELKSKQTEKNNLMVRLSEDKKKHQELEAAEKRLESTLESVKEDLQ